MRKTPEDFYELFVNEFYEPYGVQLVGSGCFPITAWPAFMILFYQRVKTLFGFSGDEASTLYDVLSQFSYDAQELIYNDLKSFIRSGNWQAKDLRATLEEIAFRNVVSHLHEYAILAFGDEPIFDDEYDA